MQSFVLKASFFIIIMVSEFFGKHVVCADDENNLDEEDTIATEVSTPPSSLSMTEIITNTNITSSPAITQSTDEQSTSSSLLSSTELISPSNSSSSPTSPPNNLPSVSSSPFSSTDPISSSVSLPSPASPTTTLSLNSSLPSSITPTERSNITTASPSSNSTVTSQTVPITTATNKSSTAITSPTTTKQPNAASSRKSTSVLSVGIAMIIMIYYVNPNIATNHFP